MEAANTLFTVSSSVAMAILYVGYYYCNAVMNDVLAICVSMYVYGLV